MCLSVGRLFVYGTLSPGQSGHHLLHDLKGSWQPGSIPGKLYPEGIGPTVGYPVVDIDDTSTVVTGQVFSSAGLAQRWFRLDAYEGEGYRRVKVSVLIGPGEFVEAYVYALDKDVLFE